MFREKVIFALKYSVLFVTVQADEEMQESESSRGLTDEEKKEKPSQLMGAVDKGFSAIANMMSDEFSMWVFFCDWSVERDFRKKKNFSLSGRESRALKKQNKDVDDDSNDFNEDYSLLDAFSRAEAEGNLSDQARGVKRQVHIPGGIQGSTGLLIDDDDHLGAYGYRAKRGNFISHACNFI